VNLERIDEMMAALARVRPLFHSEANFQHAFAWQLHSAYPNARIRLETRPQPGVRLDVMALMEGRRAAVELKYLLRALTTNIEDEVFELPFLGAQDVRHGRLADTSVTGSEADPCGDSPRAAMRPMAPCRGAPVLRRERRLRVPGRRLRRLRPAALICPDSSLAEME